MIEYHDEYAKGIGVKLYESSSGIYGYYAITNNTKDRVMCCLDYCYTDSNGKTNTYPQIFLESLEPGQTRFERTTALPSKNTRVIASAQNIGFEKTSVNKEIGYEKKETESGLQVTITNNSNKTIGRVGVTALFLDQNGKLVDIKSISSPNIYAPGYKDTVEFKYEIKSQTWNTFTGKYDYTYDKIVSCVIYIDGAFMYYYEKEDLATGIEYHGDYLKG